MVKGDCSNIYKWVLDDVAACMAPEFQAANVDEAVLQQLKSKWEEKLKVQGLIRDENDAALPEPGGTQPEVRLEDVDGEDGEDDADDGGAGTSLGKRRREEDDVPVKQETQGTSSFLPPGLIPQHDGGAGEAGDGGGDGGAPPEEAEPEGDEILSEDEHDEGQEEEEVSNLLIGQFDKVNKMKNRWKVLMKDCIFHINGRDYLFKKCTSEYTWQ